jgi:hypothetical protein
VPEKLQKIPNLAGRLSYKWQPFTHITRCLRKKRDFRLPNSKKTYFYYKSRNHATA